MNMLTSVLGRGMAGIAVLILLLVPFHAFLSVGLARLIGHYTAVRLWKEYLLALLFGAALLLFVRHRPLQGNQYFRLPFYLMLAYGALLVLSGAIALAQGSVTALAFTYGLLLNGRFLLFFVIVWMISLQAGRIYRNWRRLLLLPALVVVGFALLQYFVLPIDALKYVGYGPDTIPAVSTVDNKESYQRVQSTLRGANPLGAYLVLVMSALAALILSGKKTNPKLWLLMLASGLALVLTFSRSAWLGVLVSMVLLLWLSLRGHISRRSLLIIGSAAVLSFAGGTYLLRDNDAFQNAFFHTDEHSTSAESSNTGRARALLEGAADIINEPFGRGTGTAGPASFYNHGHQPRIAENYFLQIGQEAGIVAIGLFVAINAWLGREFWRARRDPLALALLVSLIGITLINMLSHAWADDTLAYIWWGLAGAAIARISRKDGMHDPLK